MSTARGVVSSWSAVGSRPVRVSSTEPIALVLTTNESSNEMFYFDSVGKALDYFMLGRTQQEIKTEINDGTIKGNLFKYLVWANNKYDLRIPTIVSVAAHDDDADTQKTNIINATADIKNAPAKFKMRPDIIAVPDFTTDEDVSMQLLATCDILRARTFIDLAATDGSDAITKRNNYGSERATPTYCNLKDWSTLKDATETYSAAFILSILRCAVDGSDTTRGVGWSFSLSNKLIPVSDAVNDVEFILGLGDETDLLTQNQITTFIEFNGTRVWNYQTCSADPLLQDARRVRIFDKLTFAVLPAIFPLIDSDRGVQAVKEAKDTVRDFVADMIGKEVLLGGIIELDTDLTTPTAITNGEFYLSVRTQENPVPTKIAVEFTREDIFSSVVYKTLA